MAQMATSSTDAVDAVLEKLLSVRGERPGKQVALEDNEIRMLCIRAREVFMAQPILLELEAPIKICGDVHGQYHDLLRLFEYGGFPPEAWAEDAFVGRYTDPINHPGGTSRRPRDFVDSSLATLDTPSSRHRLDA